METKLYDQLPQEAKEIRIAVFMEEQGFEDEFDEIDAIAKHAVLFVEGKPAATGRLYPGKEAGTYIVGRIAVVKEQRKHKLGAKVVEALENEIWNLGGKKVELSAQCVAKGFYEKQGYHCVGEIYMDEHCEHIKMEKVLQFNY